MDIKIPMEDLHHLSWAKNLVGGSSTLLKNMLVTTSSPKRGGTRSLESPPKTHGKTKVLNLKLCLFFLPVKRGFPGPGTEKNEEISMEIHFSLFHRNRWLALHQWFPKKPKPKRTKTKKHQVTGNKKSMPICLFHLFFWYTHLKNPWPIHGTEIFTYMNGWFSW